MRLTRLNFVRRSVVLMGAIAIVGGCTDFSSSPDSLGHLIVVAKDEAGAPVANISFTALLADRTTKWAVATTDGDGSIEFRPNDGGLLPQTYIVRFDSQATPGYSLATNETDDKPANVVAGQTVTVTFVVKKAGPGGGPG